MGRQVSQHGLQCPKHNHALKLSSSQKRGQWGERIVEDILNVIGLIEGINYTKQGVVESGERPDFTFKLPKEKIIYMDVKFPLAHYERYIIGESVT